VERLPNKRKIEGHEVTDVKVVSPAEWTAARKELLEVEAAAVRNRTELSAARRQLPVETYSSYDGEDILYSTFNYLDFTRMGPHEEDRAWLRHHDKYPA
jgi:predicted dithiol-disulfide oxidoreductase (DUF899 family)